MPKKQNASDRAMVLASEGRDARREVNFSKIALIVKVFLFRCATCLGGALWL